MNPVAWCRSQLRRRLGRYLFKIMSDAELCAREAQFAREAQIHASVRLFPTSRVYNLHGDPRRIKVGASTCVRGELLIFAHAGEIALGEDCYLGEGSRIWSASRVTIGNRVLVAHGVNIHDNNSHPLDAHKR